MNNVITLCPVKNEARIDSRVLAEHLQNQHEAVIKLIDAYKEDFEGVGVIRFEIEKPQKGTKGGRPERYALLNEDQSYLLLSFSRNTAHVRKLKVELVKAFGRFRREQQTEADYLPYYHELHDQVKALADQARQAGSATPEHVFHININRLINQAFGLTTGHRRDLPDGLRAKLTAANVVAKELLQEAMAGGFDHQSAYHHVRQGVTAFARASGQGLLSSKGAANG